MYEKSEKMELEGWLFGRRAILEALDSGVAVERIYVSDSVDGSLLHELRAVVNKRCPVDLAPKAALDRYSKGVRHQGVAARVAAVATLDLEAWLEGLPTDVPVHAILLENVEDPGNTGAVLRSAAAFGSSGLILAGRHSSPLSPAVSRVSAGGIFQVPIVRETNTVATLERLQEAGFVVFSAAEQASASVLEIQIPDRVVWVVGSEENGISTAVRRLSDEVVAIPTPGKLRSLNVATAASILMYTTIVAWSAPEE